MGLRFDRLFAILVAMVVAGQLHSQVRDAERLLTEGDHLAWLKNWQAAEPYFEKAETAFRASGDSRNALYAEVSRLRGALPKLSLIETSQALAEKLDDPLMKADLTLRLRCLVVKGDVDLDLDTELAKSDWTEALEIATKLNEEAWMNRATGELGIISFLHGDSRSGTFMVAGVLAKAEKLNDVGAQVRYLTLIGDGLVEWQRYDPSLKMFDQAISLSKKTGGLENQRWPTPARPQRWFPWAVHPRRESCCRICFRLRTRKVRRGTRVRHWNSLHGLRGCLPVCGKNILVICGWLERSGPTLA